MYLYKVLDNFPKITRSLTLHIKPVGEFMKLHILMITGTWVCQIPGQLGKICSCGNAGGTTNTCQSLSLVASDACVAFRTCAGQV